MKKVLYFILIFIAGNLHAQSLKVVDNSRNYYVNKPIGGATGDSQGLYYLLLHELYTGTMLPDMHVMGKVSGIRGNTGAYNRKWTIEVNTSSAYNATKGSLISYNEPTKLVTLAYNGKSYLAVEIANAATLGYFSFTGYANGETLQLVGPTLVSTVAPFANYDPVNITGKLNAGATTITGNLSIGTTDTAARLDIDGGAVWTTHGWTKSVKLHAARAIEFAGATRSFGLGATANGLYFANMNLDGSGPANYFMVADGTTGNMTIGGSYPVANYKLTVEGTLGARRIKVQQSGWADYVFHPNYELPSLQEVEQFVTKEKHLEGIPSEKEVLEKGLDLGDFNQQLLKKVEELTLYIIQLNKNVDALNQRVTEQQKTIEVLQHK